ncbi:MAG: hypothetical protein ACJ76H_11080, partial [Bacteriovoracaceae bacterium]
SLVGALLIILSSYRLFFSRAGNFEGITLGRVSALEKVVKIKRARALDWVDANASDLVTENQMIYTDELSQAEVEFNEGHRLVISENSLVKIRSRGKENELDVNKGSIRATLSGNEPIIVKMNGEDYELKGENANVEINLHGNVGEIGVVSGKVELAKDGKTTELDEKTALVVEGEKYSTKALAYVLLSPAKLAALYTGPQSSDIVFTWTGETSGNITLALTSDFSGDSVETYPVDGNSFRTKLSPGHWYWKLESEKGSSLVSDFRLIEETAPEILRPKNGETVDVLVDEKGTQTVRLEWTGGEAKNFSVDVDGKISEVAHEVFPATVTANELTWKVKVSDPKRPFAIWSETQKIRVKHHPFPVMPVNMYPETVEFQSFSKTPEPVELSWSSAFNADIEVKTPTKTVDLFTNTNSISFEPVEVGIHKWRVRAYDQFSRYSEWSEWKEFTIVDMSGEKTGEGVQRIKLNRPDQEVTFGWNGRGNNVFELSSDKDFQNVIVKKDVNGSETKLSVPKTGTYYWRSREFRKDGTLHVSEPKKVIIEPVAAPGKPAALPPMEVPLERVENTTTFIDRIFASAFADDVFGVARFQLPKLEHAKAYVLRIYRKGEENPVFEEKVTGPDFAWKNALPGEYDFQYAIVDYFDRQSPFSDRSSLTVKEDTAPSRALLISPIRLEKITSEKIEFKWKESDRSKVYHFELYDDENLSTKLFEEDVKTNSFELGKKLPEKAYFWKVTSVSEKGEKTPSSVGRFFYLPPKEEVIIAAPSENPAEKIWKSRAHVAWAPSSDSYKFSDGNNSGKIDGTVMMGLEGRGTIFREKWIYAGEFLRQSGKVFKKEPYSLTKLTMDAGHKWKSGKHMFTIGPSVGFGLGQSYGIEGSTVTASSVSGALYGGVVRSYHDLGQVWSAEGKLSYLLGAFTEMELSGNLLRSMKDYYLVIGAGFVGRSYTKNAGEQTSLKLNAGIGREF